MKIKVISMILALLLVQPVLCFATKGVEESFTILEDDNSTILTGTLDSISLYESINKISPNSEIPIISSDFCELSSEGYDNTTAGVFVNCGENSTFQLSVNTENDDLAVQSENGTALIFGLPLGKYFSAKIKNNANKDINCSTEVVGVGMDLTPEPGVQIFLNCINSAKTVVPTIISGIMATILLLLN